MNFDRFIFALPHCARIRFEFFTLPTLSHRFSHFSTQSVFFWLVCFVAFVRGAHTCREVSMNLKYKVISECMRASKSNCVGCLCRWSAFRRVENWLISAYFEVCTYDVNLCRFQQETITSLFFSHSGLFPYYIRYF